MFTDNYDYEGNARFHGQGITWMYYLSNWYSDIFKMLHSLLHSYYVRQFVSSRTNTKAWQLYCSTLRKLSIGSHMTGYFESWPPCRSLWNVGWFFVTSITQSSGTEHCHARSPSTREHYKEVSSPHMHTRWRQRRTTRHPSPTHRGHHRNDMCRWCDTYPSLWYHSILRDVKLRAWICRLMDVLWTLNRRPHILGFSSSQLAPSTHNESAPEQCMRCSVQNWMAEMVSTPWCRPRYGPLTSVHGCYTVQSSGASTTQTQTFWRSSSRID